MGTRVLVPVLPPPGSYVVKDGRICEIESIDAAGSYYLIDCGSNLDDEADERNIPFPVTPEELATWTRLARPEQETSGA